MQKSKNKTGSVLMEFIVVLPIYMLLLGFAFVIGEMSLTTIHLAGSGDRTQAFSSNKYDLDDELFGQFETAASPDKYGRTDFNYAGDPELGSSVRVSDYNDGRKRSVYVADNDIEGPWVEMTAGGVEDDYTLPPWTRGIVAYWYRQNYDTTDGTTQVDGPVNEMLAPGGTHRTNVRGKDLSAVGGDARRFGFYTLRRVVCREGDTSVRLTYRTWGNGQLAESGKWEEVAYEKFPNEESSEGASASSYEGIDNKEEGSPGKRPWDWMGTDLPTYPRNSKFMAWSN